MSAAQAIFCSSCLLGKRCLYHGWRCTFALQALRGLEERGFRIVDACPEMLGGLPCPRRPSYVDQGTVFQSVGRGGRRDVAAQFQAGAAKALEILREAQPALILLLKNSPACDPVFGVFGKQAALEAPTVACKRGTSWEAEMHTIISDWRRPQERPEMETQGTSRGPTRKPRKMRGDA